MGACTCLWHREHVHEGVVVHCCGGAFRCDRHEYGLIMAVWRTDNIGGLLHCPGGVTDDVAWSTQHTWRIDKKHLR